MANSFMSSASSLIEGFGLTRFQFLLMENYSQQPMALDMF
jgi:hypothetical protein